MNNVTGQVFNEWYAIFLNSINELALLVGSFLPRLLGALVLLFVGVFIAKSARSIVSKLLKITKIEDTLKHGALEDVIKSAGVKLDLVSFILNLTYWTVILVVVMSIADVLGLPIVSSTISDLISYIPNILAGLIVAILTFSFSKIVRDLVVVGMEKLDVDNNKTLGGIVQILINIFGLLIAVNQLGFDLSLVYTNLTLIIGALMLSLVIIFSYGSKDVAANLIAGYYVKKMFSKGDSINVGGLRGHIKQMSAFNIVLDKDGDILLIPYTRVMETGSF